MAHWIRSLRIALTLASGIALAALGQAQAPGAPEAASASAPGNVYLAGATARPAGPVQGDLVAFGGRVIADQAVDGDALLLGGSVDVRAPIGDDLRAAGGDISIETRIGGELMAAGGNLTLTRSARVRQGALLAGGVVTVDGEIRGRLKASAQRIVINGRIDGDAQLFAERIELGPTAHVAGALHHASRELQRAPGAVVDGPVTIEARRDGAREQEHDRRDFAPWQRHWQASGPAWVGLALGFLGLLAAGTVYVLLFPKFAVEAPDHIRASPWLALAVGFGTLVGVPVLAVLLIVTVLGIPLGVATLALYPVLLLVGYLSGALFLALRARQGLQKAGPGGGASTVAYLALALVILMLLGLLPLVGPLTVLLTTLFGLGACVLDLQRRRQAPAAAAP